MGGKNGPADEPADHALGRSRGGFSSKIHLVCDSLGWIIAVLVGPGQQNECTRFEELMDEVRVDSSDAGTVITMVKRR